MKRTARGAPRPGVRVRRTQKERREATIHTLVDATLESLLAVGYARTTVKEICGRAGLSHGALFRFFPTVLDLVIAAGEELAHRQIAFFEKNFAPAPGEKPFAAGLRLLREACRSESNTIFYELIIAARTDRTLHKALQPAMQRYYAAIRETATRVPGTEDFPPELLEVLLFSAIHLFDGETLSRLVVKQPALEERRMELLVQAFEAARSLRTVGR